MGGLWWCIRQLPGQVSALHDIEEQETCSLELVNPQHVKSGGQKEENNILIENKESFINKHNHNIIHGG